MMIARSRLRLPAVVVFLIAALGFSGWRVHKQLAVDLGESFLPETGEEMQSQEEDLPVRPVMQAVRPSGERPTRDPFRYPPRPVPRRVVKRLPPIPTLQGVRGGNSPAAWLNGGYVKVGDAVGVWTVSRIEEDRVRLSGPDGIEKVVEAR